MSSRRHDPRWTFALVSAGGVMMTLDVTVVNVALSDVARDLETGLDRVQWTVSAYSLAFGALLLTAGALSDRLGRRAVFTAGMALFTLASAACGLAPDAGALIAARTAQGLGGAMVFAPTLALIAAAYDGARRRAAIAAYALVASAAGALGPIVGGLLVTGFGWRWIFLVNVPIGLLVVAGALRRMPGAAAPDDGRPRVDVPGALLAVGTLLALHYPLVTGPEAGWTAPEVLGSAGAGVLLAAALVAVQRRGGGLVDMTLLRIRAFSGAAVLGFLARLSSLGMLAFLTLWLQSTYGYSPLRTGLLLLPLTGGLLITGLFVNGLQKRFPAHVLVAAGFAAQGLGLLLLALAGAGTGQAVLVTGLALLGAGGAVIFPPLMGVAVGTVPEERAGMASGLTNACYPLGTATGVAVFGAVFAARLDSGLGAGPTAAAPVREAVETGRFDLLAPALRAPATTAFSGAFTAVCLAAALVCLLGVAASRALRPDPGPSGAVREPRPRARAARAS
ncbi:MULTISPECIES: MFS transporter [Streptomyces]|uniref:MFS transporter n=2 Tax=Streptomyces TaxID=1883 RepID=A0ABU4KGF1_9ACTN|nr:MFS transporter [Streptomyces roseolus]MDX2296880.1 MFS transporter [Streptomyces roseolus]